MIIQPINTYPKQPNFNSRARINQEKKLIYVPKTAYSNLRLIPGDAVIGQDLINKKINKSDKTYDSFTGLRDKKYLISVLNKKMEQCQKENKNLSIAMFDMDNFKSINELLGYETGDNFIRAIGQGVKEEADKNFLHVYRFGGDEFIIVFNDESPEKQKEIADTITEKINNNKYIKSKENEYQRNAMDLLYEYSSSSQRIQELMSLKSKKAILDDVHNNLTTNSAKNDPYLTKTRDAVERNINSLYIELISECITNEQDKDTRKRLERISKLLESNNSISQNQEMNLDEYLLSVYDKSAQIYQTKKWLSDFHINKGFSISGGVATYSPESLKDQTSLDIINQAGEVLKKGKNTKKGTNYIQTV